MLTKQPLRRICFKMMTSITTALILKIVVNISLYLGRWDFTFIVYWFSFHYLAIILCSPRLYKGKVYNYGSKATEQVNIGMSFVSIHYLFWIQSHRAQFPDKMGELCPLAFSLCLVIGVSYLSTPRALSIIAYSLTILSCPSPRHPAFCL